MQEFISFKKIVRYSREVIVTEKIDGTNAQVFIGNDGEFLTGSRNRWITPEADNYGFSKWAYDHKDELMMLGPGRHYGEWWGSGINRGYGLIGTDKRFSIFNVIRWCKNEDSRQQIHSLDSRVVAVQDVLPPCVSLVPVLWRGRFDDMNLSLIMGHLHLMGSVAAPGYMRPEGVVIYHVVGNVLFKKTLEKDETPKSIAR